MIPRLAITLVAALLGGIQDQPSAPQEQAVSDAIVEGDSAQAAPVSPDRVEMDRQIREDLMATFGRIPGLEGVEARVEAGVVFLAGTVLTTDRYALADSLASRMPGVLYVDNGIAEETSLRVRLNPVWADLQQKGLRGLALIPLLLVAAGVTLFFLFLARGIYRWEAPFNRLGTNPFLRNLLRQAAAGVVALLGVLLALELLDATALVGAVLGAAGVVGIAVGFAFRNIAENYLAGIILSVRQPFFPNDQVLVEGQEGKVIRLTSRETVLMTLDGNHVRIPNATIFNSVIINYTKNPLRRFQFDLSVGQEEELGRVQEIALTALGSMEGILTDPGPRANIVEVGDSWVLLRFFGWVDQNQVAFDKARSEAIRLTKEALDGKGVQMPAPEYGLRFLGQLQEGAGLSEPALPTGSDGEDAIPSDGASDSVRGPSKSHEPAQAPDLSPDRELEAQIEEDRGKAGERDLLNQGS